MGRRPGGVRVVVTHGAACSRCVFRSDRAGNAEGPVMAMPTPSAIRICSRCANGWRAMELIAAFQVIEHRHHRNGLPSGRLSRNSLFKASASPSLRGPSAPFMPSEGVRVYRTLLRFSSLSISFLSLKNLLPLQPHTANGTPEAYDGFEGLPVGCQRKHGGRRFFAGSRMTERGKAHARAISVFSGGRAWSIDRFMESC